MKVMTDERLKWLREYLTPVKDIVPVTMECLDEIDRLRAQAKWVQIVIDEGTTLHAVRNELKRLAARSKP